jgi:hypothetical protein
MLSLPTTLEHTAQFLGFIPQGVWEQVQAKAEQLRGKNRDQKIKRSSFTKIMTSSPRKIAAEIVKEFVQQIQDADYIQVGRLHDALLLILTKLADDLGTDTVDGWVGLELETAPITDLDRMRLVLLQEMYERVFAEEISEYARLPAFDTECSAIWFDGKRCVLTVGPPVKRIRDIAKIERVNSEPLKKVLKKFCEEYTNIPILVVTHSYGYQLFMECVERPKLDGLFAFNPHSQKHFSHHPIKTKIFDNVCDTTCKNYNLSYSSLRTSAVSVAYSPDYSSSLQQWKEKETLDTRVFVV